MKRVVTKAAILIFVASLAGACPSVLAVDKKENDKPDAAGTAEPSGKRRGFFQRFFSRPERTPVDQSKIKRALPVEEKKEAEPTPKPSPTPRKKAEEPAAKPTPKATPKPAPTPTPALKATPEPAATPAPKAAPTPEPAAKTEPSDFERAPAFVPDPAPRKDLTVSDLVSDDYEAKQRTRYEKLKAAALQDEQVARLKEQAETAPAGKEKDAMRAYYRALFGKMRGLDKSMAPRIDMMEKATQKRIDRM